LRIEIEISRGGFIEQSTVFACRLILIVAVFGRNEKEDRWDSYVTAVIGVEQ
jgi:hypothetical protein